MINISKPQQAIYEMDRYIGGSVANIAGVIFFSKETSTTTLYKVVQELITTNDSLRTNIVINSSIPMQKIREYSDYEVTTLFFDTEQQYENWANDMAQVGMDIFADLFEFVIISTPSKNGIYIKLHHIIGDAWSLSVLAQQAKDLIVGNSVISYQYKDYLLKEQTYINSERYLKDRKFWMTTFDMNSEINFLSDKIAKGYLSERFSVSLTNKQTDKLRAFCRENQQSEFALFLAVVSAYFYRRTGKNKFYIGTPVLNRCGAKEKSMIGTFINTIPLAISIEDTDDFTVLSNKITNNISACFRHQKFLYNDILKMLRDERNLNGGLFDVILSYQNAKVGDSETKWYFTGLQNESIQIHIDDRDDTGSLTINYDYQTEKFSSLEIARIHTHILNILEDVIEYKDKKLYELEILSADERDLLLRTFNNTAVDYQKNKCVHTHFEEHVLKNSTKPAIIACDTTLTYEELNEQANMIAHNLIAKGIKQNEVVAFILTRKSYLLSTMFGILKSGAAYMPIDPDYPRDRIDYMLEDSGAKICIDEHNIADYLTGNNRSNPNITMSSNSLCYCIYTSGSTGKPKGTLLTHGNVVNYCNSNEHNVMSKIVADNNFVFGAITTVGFDIFVTESLLPMVNGMTTVLASEAQSTSQSELNELILCTEINVLQTTPSKMQVLMTEDRFNKYLSKIKCILLGGEALNSIIVNRIRKFSDARIFNCYGPTETTVFSTLTEITSEDLHIGKPIANTQIYILDKHHNLLPIGAVGELCIAGDGVAVGYHNQPELTAEKFARNPYGTGTMYKTGDLAKWKSDGDIEYLGRNDFQVKIRGLRIELGEIENVLSTYEGVKQVAVKVEKDENDRQYICAYYIAECELEIHTIREFMEKKLPQYMVPHFFTKLDKMPQTSSGKIDRKALPKIEFNLITTNQYVAPVTPAQKSIADLMSNVLQIPQVGLTDNFFEIGGDSLRAIEFVSKAHSAGICFNLQAVFDNPTIEKLCEYIENDNKNHNIYKKTDFDKYSQILAKNARVTNFSPVVTEVGDVLITGATGFLGIHMLADYLQNDTGKAYCLVRGNKSADSKERLLKLLNYYFGNQYNSLIDTRIFVLCGDITNKNLTDSEMPKVETIIHVAASVKHYGSYSYFYDINVNGTRNVIALAKKQNAKLLHISTLSVSGNSLTDQFDVYKSAEHKDFFESSLYIEQPLDNVYIRSKFEAELAVLDAMLDGLQANIMRIGNLTNRSNDFKFQLNYKENSFLSRLKAILEFGMFPDYLLSLYAEFSPVDDTARAVMTCARNFSMEHTIFHINSQKVVYFDKLLKYLKKANVAMNVVDAEEFVGALKGVAASAGSKYIYESLINDMDEDYRLVYDSNISIKNDYTVWYLQMLGFDWSDIDYKYISGYLDYFRTIGFLGV